MPEDIDTKPPPAPEDDPIGHLIERLPPGIVLDVARRLDSFSERVEANGRDGQEALKLLHTIAQSQARSEVAEANRHAALDIQLNRIETKQDTQANELLRHRQELSALRVDDEKLRRKLDELAQQIADLARQIVDLAQRLDDHSRRLDDLAVRDSAKGE
jgi:chromosome segregation ATPase